jgi:hypothetical protein
MPTAASILWRRLDLPGHDACRLVESADGWELEGVAVFTEELRPACLAYRLTSDHSWLTKNARVSGWVGKREIALEVQQSSRGVWSLNGQSLPGLHECVNLDLGFTPATNLLQLRRLDLGVGERADAPVAWLDVLESQLDVLFQVYERRTLSSYWYEAPRFEYSGLLEVSTIGFVRSYPGLWDVEVEELSERKW